MIFMKVLTIREPYATLILNRVKTIETRSWKTNYRGELYIHAGASKISKAIRSMAALSKLYDPDKLNYGHIICKCNLVDCVYMTEEYIEQEKRNDPDNFVAGYYAVGRYAWILKNIAPITPIEAKGKLGLWTYNKP